MWGASTSLPLSPSRMGVSTGGHHLNESDPSLSAGERSPAVQPNASDAGTSMGGAYSGHLSPWKLYCFHHCMVLWSKAQSSLLEHSSSSSLFDFVCLQNQSSTVVTKSGLHSLPCVSSVCPHTVSPTKHTHTYIDCPRSHKSTLPLNGTWGEIHADRSSQWWRQVFQ